MYLCPEKSSIERDPRSKRDKPHLDNKHQLANLYCLFLGALAVIFVA